MYIAIKIYNKDFILDFLSSQDVHIDIIGIIASHIIFF